MPQVTYQDLVKVNVLRQWGSHCKACKSRKNNSGAHDEGTELLGYFKESLVGGKGCSDERLLDDELARRWLMGLLRGRRDDLIELHHGLSTEVSSAMLYSPRLRSRAWTTFQPVYLGSNAALARNALLGHC